MSLDEWVVRPDPKPNACAKLFCFHSAGSGASMFRSWTCLLPAQVELCIIQLPGRESRYCIPRFDRLPPLLDALLAYLEPWLDRPFFFFGHSLGALIAFETSRRLLAQRISPLSLFVAAHRAPDLPPKRPPLAQASDSVLIEALRELQGIPEAVFENGELLQLLLPIIRDDFKIAESYHFNVSQQLSCPISVFGGSDDPWVNEAALDAWRTHTSGAFIRRSFPGRHFFLNTVQKDVLCAMLNQIMPEFPFNKAK